MQCQYCVEKWNLSPTLSVFALYYQGRTIVPNNYSKLSSFQPTFQTAQPAHAVTLAIAL